MSDKMSSIRANSAWHIENLIEHDPECQVVELCVAEQLEEKCNILTNRVKVLEEALSELMDKASECDSWESFPAQYLDAAQQALEADNG